MTKIFLVVVSQLKGGEKSVHIRTRVGDVGSANHQENGVGLGGHVWRPGPRVRRNRGDHEMVVSRVVGSASEGRREQPPPHFYLYQ